MASSKEENSDSTRNRTKLTRPDIVVMLVVIVILVGLFIPAVTRIRDSGGNRARCANNLKQIGLATQAAHDMFNRLPPAFGTFAKKPTLMPEGKSSELYPATIFYHILPNLEAAGVYDRLPPLFNYPAENKYVSAPNPPIVGQGAPDENAAAFKMRTYICPSDVSGDPSGINELALTPEAERSAWGTNGYAANYLLFGLIKDPRLPESVPDGMSTTIFFTEKAPLCADTTSGRTGGNLWAVPPFFPSDTRALVNYGSSFGYDPSSDNPTRPYTLKLFQHAAAGQCDPTLPQTPHTGGINVSMGDTRVTFITNTVSPKTWSALMTPYPLPGIQSRSDQPDGDWQ